MEEWRRLHEVNVLGLLRVLHACLPAMQARAAHGADGGHLVNIASAAGLVSFPGLSAYGANKSAVVTLSESRSEEQTSELQSLMRDSYAVFRLKKKKRQTTHI